MPRSWLDQEPGVLALLHALRRLYGRAFARRWLTLGLAVVVSLALVGALALKSQVFAPRVVLRAIEADQASRAAPRPKRHLRDHVREAVFTNLALTEVMREHRLYPSLATKNPQAALASFKEDIQVEVYRNYFVEERAVQDPPRSARINIRYRSPDRRLSLEVARDLGKLIAEHEAKTRKAQVERATRQATLAVARARAALVHQRQEIAKRALAANLLDPQARVELANLSSSIDSLERRLTEAERNKASLDLYASIEAQRMGLRFEVVDAGAIPESAGAGTDDLILLGMLAFTVGLPLSGLAVGAFDTRIHDMEDLRRLRLPVLGQMRALHPRKAGLA